MGHCTYCIVTIYLEKFAFIYSKIGNFAVQKQYLGVLKLSIQIDHEYVKIINFCWRTFLTNQQ